MHTQDAPRRPLLDRLADLLFPPLCPVTGAQLDRNGTLSPTAWADLGRIALPSRCGKCGREIPGAAPGADLLCEPCAAQPRPWDRGASALRYEGTGRALVLALKRRDRLDIVPMLARWMLAARPELVAEADLIAPVPLHWRRRLARRFNQSAELARAVCRLAGRSEAYAPRLLRRTRATPSQGGLDRKARVENVAGAFSLAPGIRLARQRVLIVDDVLTTGATLSACAQLCKTEGAAAVDVLVCALVSRDDRPYLSAASDEEDPNHGES